MQIYCTSDNEGSAYFFKLEEARTDAKRCARGGHESTIYEYVVKKLTKEIFLAAINDRGWADKMHYLETWGPVFENDEVKDIERFYRVRPK